MLSQQINAIKKRFENRFIRNLSWLGASELIIRIFRLVTTFLLARFLNSYDYGLAAIVLSVHEFIQVFTRVGIFTKVVQADEEELPSLCNSAYWLNWLVFITIFIVQCIAAFPIAQFYNDSRLILPIEVSALVYLIIPIASIQAALVTRENRLKLVALQNTLQVTAVNVLMAIFAVMKLGMWAIVLPTVLCTPIWVITFYTAHSWRPSGGFTTKHWLEMLKFCKNILGVQLLKTVRNNMDYWIIGRFVGIKELGIYYFAFNAGLGISLSIVNAVNSALLPHLCALREDWAKLKKNYWGSLKTIALLILPLVLLQSTLAPFYVPIIFGQKWVVAIPVLILICLSAIPRPFADAASQLLVTIGRPDIDFRWNIVFTAIFSLAIFAGVQWNALGVATAVLLTHMILLPLFTIWATRYVFREAKG